MLYIFPTDTCFGIACLVSEIEDYNKIYKIKKRPLTKPLAIMILDFSYLENFTRLNDKQINFLKNYENPWTILIDKQKVLDKNLLEIIEKLPNSNEYKKIAFRVANKEIQTNLIKNNGPIFLTSANISNNPEIFSTQEIKKEFGNIIEKENIKILVDVNFQIKSKKNNSDIFEFEGESEEVKYFRK